MGIPYLTLCAGNTELQVTSNSTSIDGTDEYVKDGAVLNSTSIDSTDENVKDGADFFKGSIKIMIQQVAVRTPSVASLMAAAPDTGDANNHGQHLVFSSR